jgi:hypothetical protein
MDVVGYIATIVVAMIVIGVVALALLTIPDIRRYLRIRNM